MKPENKLSFEVQGESSSDMLRRLLNQVSLNGEITRFYVEIESSTPLRPPEDSEAVEEPEEDVEEEETVEEAVEAIEKEPKESDAEQFPVEGRAQAEADAVRPFSESEYDETVAEEGQRAGAVGEGQQAGAVEEEPEEEYECDVCGETFSTPQARGSHKRVHTSFSVVNREDIDEQKAEDEGKTLVYVGDDVPPISEEKIPNLSRTSRAYKVLKVLVDRDTWMKTEDVRQMTPKPHGIPSQAFASILYQLYDRGLADRRPQSTNENRYEYTYTTKGKAALLKANEDTDEPEVIAVRG